MRKVDPVLAVALVLALSPVLAALAATII